MCTFNYDARVACQKSNFSLCKTVQFSQFFGSLCWVQEGVVSCSLLFECTRHCLRINADSEPRESASASNALCQSDIGATISDQAPCDHP